MRSLPSGAWLVGTALLLLCGVTAAGVAMADECWGCGCGEEDCPCVPTDKGPCVCVANQLLCDCPDYCSHDYCGDGRPACGDEPPNECSCSELLELCPCPDYCADVSQCRWCFGNHLPCPCEGWEDRPCGECDVCYSYEGEHLCVSFKCYYTSEWCACHGAYYECWYDAFEGCGAHCWHSEPGCEYWWT